MLRAYCYIRTWLDEIDTAIRLDGEGGGSYPANRTVNFSYGKQTSSWGRFLFYRSKIAARADQPRGSIPSPLFAKSKKIGTTQGRER